MEGRRPINIHHDEDCHGAVRSNGRRPRDTSATLKDKVHTTREQSQNSYGSQPCTVHHKPRDVIIRHCLGTVEVLIIEGE
ncbi:hypothetical protein H920_06048 [Fukomys damarensis]|uniref:Uncharacterized protein n=1 Tax=Fukomys damarensis TaxID=885580 RepID=A0A091DN12_FUKDA|nr:hypothetical protein H920_06048 [Fukomys damarensis]